jgi:hypothetical protein
MRADFDPPQVGRLPERRFCHGRLRRDDGVDDLEEQRRRGLRPTNAGLP